MPKIKLLDPDTINQIAAGEVIERPASVVKELVENSLDAGAGRIMIEVSEGGKSLIRVTDDGCGMEADDLKIAFLRHATSKIAEAEDLYKVSTLGFRGEALSSIASVARTVEVTTKTRSALGGTYMRLQNGNPAEIRDAGSPIGTTITVRDLFYNVPARKKHLRTAEAELAAIVDLITEMAIINFEVAFELFSGRRTLFKSSKSSSWNDCLIQVFGLEATKGMRSFQAETPQWTLLGLAADPLNTRSSADRIFIYVNSRAVYSKALTAALRDAYRNLIPTGKNPMAVVSLDIAPELVDVNVHPAKREIRLLPEEEISRQLFLAVSEALQAGATSSPTVTAPRAELPDRAELKVARASEQSVLPLDPSGQEVEVTLPEKSELRILGQILQLYIVAEGKDGLVLIDQHAAAERIRFERLRERYEKKKISQELAEPLTIDLAPNEQLLLESWQEALREMGFQIEPFGGCTYQVRAVPALGSRLEKAEAVHDILRDLFTSGKVSPASTNRDEILKLLACRGSIKSGKVLSESEMRALLKELFTCKNPLTCPHGRPVMVILGQAELERLFSRR
jgi:DNA mismatch repair protein MutL